MAAVKESYSVHVCVCTWVCVCVHVFEPAHSYIAYIQRGNFHVKNDSCEKIFLVLNFHLICEFFNGLRS